MFVSPAKEVCEAALLKEDQAPRHVQITASASQDGQECRLVMEDITARRQAEAETRRLASFPLLNPRPIVEVDAAGDAPPAPQASLQPRTEAQHVTVQAPVSAAQSVAAVPSVGHAGPAGNPTSPSVPTSHAGSGPSPGSTAARGREMLTQARPNYLHNPSPPYPPLAKRRGLTGAVVLKVLVGRDGFAKEVAVRSSSGHPVLDEAAVSTVAGWRFNPARRGDVSVDSWVDVPIRFELNRGEG